MRRTITDARRDFEETILPRVSDYHARRFRTVLEAAEKRAQEHAAGYIAQREREALDLRDAALRELTEVRDAYDGLSATADIGRTTGREYAEELSRLRQRQETADEQLDRAARVVAEIEKVEADPVAWYDDQSTRLKHLKADFPW